MILHHRQIIALPVLILWCLTGMVSPANADDGDRTHGELVQALADDFGLYIEAPQRWEAAGLRSLWQGAKSVPPPMWETVGGAVRIEYVPDRACLFSMGRYNEHCPTFGDSEGRHFFIYASTPASGQGTVQQMKLLTAEEQRDLQLRRAMVHLVMVHADRQFGWSESWQWMAINGWQPGEDQPRNRDPYGYSRYLGMHSPHLDLVTFAEEYFVRPKDLLLEAPADDERAQSRLAAIDPDQTVTCTQFTRRRIFGDRLRQYLRDWSEPRRELPRRDKEGPLCPAFEQWAQADEVQGFELWYSDRAEDRLESVLGYLILAVRYEDGQGDGHDSLFHFGAVTGDDVGFFQYVIQGVLGGYPAVLRRDYRDEDQRHDMEHMRRDYRRYRLNLSGEEKRYFLERIWEAQHQVRYPYLFLTRNYASLLLDLLAPSLRAPLEGRHSFFVTTPDVLETLARQPVGEEDVLLEKIPEPSVEGAHDRPRRSIASSGRHRIHFGGGWAPEQRWGTGRLSYSLIDERLGEQRRRGLQADLGLRLFGIDAVVPVDRVFYRDLRLDVVVLSFQTIQRAIATPRGGIRDWFGWGIDGRIVYDARRQLWGALEMTPTVLVPLWTTGQGVNHLIAMGGPALRIDVHESQSPLGGGVAGVMAQFHLYGNYANILRLQANTGQYVGLKGQRKFDVTGRMELRHALLHRDERPLVLVPFVEGLWSTRDYRDEAPSRGFQSWEAGMQVELPF